MGLGLLLLGFRVAALSVPFAVHAAFGSSDCKLPHIVGGLQIACLVLDFLVGWYYGFKSRAEKGARCADDNEPASNCPIERGARLVRAVENSDPFPSNLTAPKSQLYDSIKWDKLWKMLVVIGGVVSLILSVGCVSAIVSFQTFAPDARDHAHNLTEVCYKSGDTHGTNDSGLVRATGTLQLLALIVSVVVSAVGHWKAICRTSTALALLSTTLPKSTSTGSPDRVDDV